VLRAHALSLSELILCCAATEKRKGGAILGLSGTYTDARLEAACRKAAAAGDPSYRTIRNILAAGLEDVEHDRPTGDAGAPAFLHGPEQLFADVIPFPTPPAVTRLDTAGQTRSDRRDDAGDGEPDGAAS
jgi:hypothetical protein